MLMGAQIAIKADVNAKGPRRSNYSETDADLEAEADITANGGKRKP